jgi:hypothetical protein
MSTQLTLAFTVKVAGTSYGPAKAAIALAAVPLYTNTGTDPVLGQFFGLSVASDTHTNDSVSATRTIVLNMVGATAPPPFPCNPITATPPVLPYPLLKPKPLPGTFLTTPNSVTVLTSYGQTPSLTAGDTVQFQAQPGVFYTIASGPVVAGSITLTAAYTGPFSADCKAAKMIPAPAPIAAIYSTSPLDSAAGGSGAQIVSLSYYDSTGAGPFTVDVNLVGTFPSIVLLHSGSIDISIITDMHIATVGAFGNSVGQITLCELSSPSPTIPSGVTAKQLRALTDQAQMLITRGLVYLPPSYFAFAQQSYALQGASPLLGDFTLPGRKAHASNVVGGKSVRTTVDQTSALSAGNTIEFAAQPGCLYTIEAVARGNITLATPWTGLNDNPIASGAILVTPSPAAPPTTAQLSGGVSEFVNPGTAVPPPSLPLAPQMMTPSPTFLSGMFARTLQLALAVPVVQVAIVVS